MVHNPRDIFEQATSSQQANFYEWIIQAAAREFCKPGSVAIDAGANGGAHTKVMAESVGRTGKVHAFEPDPRIVASQLVPMQQTYPWITLHQVALSDHEGTGRFMLATHTALSSLVLRPFHGMEVESEIAVPLSRLDRVPGIVDGGRIAVIKADVEGSDVPFLKGASRTMARHRPIVFLEYDYRVHHENVQHRFGPLGKFVTRERVVRNFLRWVRRLGGGYVPLDFFGNRLTEYNAYDWEIILAPDDLDFPRFEAFLLAAGRTFFRDFLDWTQY